MDMITMALKSFGLNPDDVKKQMQDVYTMCKHFDDSLTELLKNQKLIMEKLNVGENQTKNNQLVQESGNGSEAGIKSVGGNGTINLTGNDAGS